VGLMFYSATLTTNDIITDYSFQSEKLTSKTKQIMEICVEIFNTKEILGSFYLLSFIIFSFWTLP